MVGFSIHENDMDEKTEVSQTPKLRESFGYHDWIPAKTIPDHRNTVNTSRKYDMDVYVGNVNAWHTKTLSRKHHRNIDISRPFTSD